MEEESGVFPFLESRPTIESAGRVPTAYWLFGAIATSFVAVGTAISSVIVTGAGIATLITLGTAAWEIKHEQRNY